MANITASKCLRSPICSVLGHVDHGKSSILDKIRGSAITAKEAGGITQAIGASIIPLETIKKICGKLLETLKMDFTIPGLLFVDTPGHEAFTSMRKRGGSLADIAVLVIDINEGFKPQTVEALEILKNYKTPFIIAANKIDLISGWKPNPKISVLASIPNQPADTVQIFEKRIYELVGAMYEKFGMNSERFDRVDDFTKAIAIVPCSAKTGEGIPELIMVIAGLAQKFLEHGLKLDVKGNAKGTILEIKEEKGLGHTMDVIIYDGTLNVGDTIVIGALNEPIIAKVKALFQPDPLAEMRDKKSKFRPVKSVCASTGVKISAPETEKAIAGMPLWSAGIAGGAGGDKILEEIKKKVQAEIESIVIETDRRGIVIKADSLGALEALIKIFKQKNVSIRKATIGEITKKDIADAESNYAEDPFQAVILGFNLNPSNEILASSGNVKIIVNEVIYRLVEDFDKWQVEKKKEIEAKELDDVIRPCKIQIMRGYVFRQSSPAVVGCEILLGSLKPGCPLMNNEGRTITTVKAMQKDKDNVSLAKKGVQLAISMDNVTVGRQIKEGDILYSAVPDTDFRKMKQLKKHLSNDEIEAIKEIAEVMRKQNSMWGV